MLKPNHIAFSFFLALLICFGAHPEAQAQPQKQSPAVPNSAISRPSPIGDTKAEPSSTPRGVAPTGILPQTYLRKPATPKNAQNQGSSVTSALFAANSNRYNSSSFPDIMKDMNAILTTLPPVIPFVHTRGQTDYSALTPPTGSAPKLVDLRK